MKKLVFIVCMCIIASTSFAQKKAVKDARSESKAKNFDVARSLIKGALTNPETENEAEAWYVAGLIENEQFDSEKIKEYEEKQPDADKMYPSLDRILPYFIKADSLDQLPDSKGKVKSKYRKDIKSIMLINRPYYVNAAQYFYDKKNFQKAYENFKLYGDIPKLTMFDGDPIQSDTTVNDTILTTIRYYAGIAAAQIPNIDATILIFEDIKDSGVEEDKIYQQLASMYHQKKDTVNYVRILKGGAEKFKDESYYILNLINITLAQGNVDEAESFLLKAIEVDQNNPQLYDVLGLVYENNKEIDRAVASIKKAIEIDPTYSEALSHLGRLYYNQGVEKRASVDVTGDRKAYEKEMETVNSYFKEAIPYFLKAYEINPKDSDAVFALRNIYYSLGMNKEYEEMDKIYSGGANK